MSLIVGEKNWCIMISLLIVLAMMYAIAGDDSVTLYEGDSCTTKSNEGGICTIIWKCQVYMQGLRSKTIEYKSILRCGFVGTNEVVCCPLDFKPTILVERITPTFSTVPAPISDETEAPPRAAVTSGPRERPSQAVCRRYKELDPAGLSYHIMNGVPVPLGVYAHMAALLQPGQAGGNDTLELRCGSSLINEWYVLTAAHCVSDPMLMPTIVRFGVVSLSGDEVKPLDVEIEDTLMHPNYTAPSTYHDIALIKLFTKVNFEMNIRPVCLYSDTDDLDPSKQLTVIGWGQTSLKTRALSDELLMANLTTISLSTCNQTYLVNGPTRQFRNGIHIGQYCAMDVKPGNTRDACKGDSGGPLQLRRDGMTNLVGIVSFGFACATDKPGIYARVAFYLDWIESVVWPSEL